MSEPQSNQPGSIPTFLPQPISAHPAEAHAQIPDQLRAPAKIILEGEAFL